MGQVQLANWGELPNIVPTAIIAAAIAFLMTRTQPPRTRAGANWSALIKIAIFIFAGIFVVFWQGSLNGEGNNLIERSADAWDRLGIWIDIAINGGVSADQLPFALIMMTATWTLAYAVHNPHIPIPQPVDTSSDTGSRTAHKPFAPNRNARADLLPIYARRRRSIRSPRRLSDESNNGEHQDSHSLKKHDGSRQETA